MALKYHNLLMRVSEASINKELLNFHFNIIFQSMVLHTVRCAFSTKLDGAFSCWKCTIIYMRWTNLVRTFLYNELFNKNYVILFCGFLSFFLWFVKIIIFWVLHVTQRNQASYFRIYPKFRFWIEWASSTFLMFVRLKISHKILKNKKEQP